MIGTNQIGNGTAITSENLATYGIETTGDVVIPEYVTDGDNTRHAVTSISDYAFRDCNEMTSVAIADSVTEIGTGAFVNCSRLSRAAVPNSVRSIGNSAFDGCISLSLISYNGNEYDLSNIEPAFVENGVSVGSHVFEHSYSAPVYTWSEDNSTCTATKTCSECHDVVTETADVSMKTADATCTNEGLNTYTATFKNSDFETQTKTSNISALGHKYGTPTYTWSEDGQTCTAKRVCTNNASHIETENGTITHKVKTAATYTTKGTTTYTATFKNTAFVTQTKDIQDIPVLEKLTGSVVLSATSGTISYPTAGSFTVTSNKSNGTLSVKSSNPNVATAALDGNTVTVTPGTTAGSAIITVTSAATTSYKAASATYNVTVKSGTLPITAKAYSGTYDGNAHGINVTSAGATIKYGTVNGTYNLTSSPTYTDAGTYTVYYQVSKTGYTTVTGSKNVVINKAANTLTLSATNVNYSNPITVEVTNNISGGAIKVFTDGIPQRFVTVNGNTITITVSRAYLYNQGVNKFDVIVQSAETNNYKKGQAVFYINL